MADPARRPHDPLRRIRGALALTRTGLVAERLARAFWPLWAAALLVVAAVDAGPARALAAGRLLGDGAGGGRRSGLDRVARPARLSLAHCRGRRAAPGRHAGRAAHQRAGRPAGHRGGRRGLAGGVEGAHAADAVAPVRGAPGAPRPAAGAARPLRAALRRADAVRGRAPVRVRPAARRPGARTAGGRCDRGRRAKLGGLGGAARLYRAPRALPERSVPRGARGARRAAAWTCAFTARSAR